jgi:hypothetical protein
MELEIRPEPPEQAARAIEQALQAASTQPPESAWWRAGIDEALAEDDC